MDINVVLLQWFINFFNTSSGAVKNEIMSDQKLAEELHKPLIRKFEKRKVCSYFEDNIFVANLADMQLMCY